MSEVALKLSITNARELTTLVKRCEEDPKFPPDQLERLRARRDEAQKIVKELQN